MTRAVSRCRKQESILKRKSIQDGVPVAIGVGRYSSWLRADDASCEPTTDEFMVGLTGRFNAAAITQRKMVNDRGAYLSLLIIAWHSAPRPLHSSTTAC
jgi:hypothetical protein